jgi:AcrR family transcriptional regulator
VVRETLPQQRARETRTKILGAARKVFGDRGFGHATVEEIAAGAGVSNGALYHHFANKQELFKAILTDHIAEQHFEISALDPAASLRELLERFASYWFEHLRKDHDAAPLFAEIWAQAARDPWARQAVMGFIGDGVSLIENGIRIGEETGLVRPDIDRHAVATLIFATMQGLFLLWTVDHAALNQETLTKPWVDSMERILATDEEPDPSRFQEGVRGLLDDSGSQPSPRDGEN